MKKFLFGKALIAIVLCFPLAFYSCEDEDNTVNGIIVTMDNNLFNPSSTTVSPGTTVTWVNEETVLHTVTSDAPLFDSGDMEEGVAFSYVFDQPGRYNYHCEHHSGMTGTVIVE